MPTSDLDWKFSTGPIFQVYGTKRKAAEDAMEAHHCDSLNDQLPKRRCSWQAQQQQQLHQQPLSQNLFTNNNNNNNNSDVSQCQINEYEMNHNSHAMQDQQQLYEQQQHLQQPIVHPGLTHVMSQQPPRVPSPWPLQQTFIHAQTEDHIMDLNEGTFTPCVSAEMDLACTSMDSDSTQNSAQYTSASQHTSSRTASPESEFCKSYCGRGETSPNSGRVRCFCKPSWEGMLDMKPYISDVY